MEEILSWSHLGTGAAVSAVVTGLTQVLKYFIPEKIMNKLDPKWIALALSVIITIGHQMIYGDFAIETFALSALNAVMSTGAAIGGYEGLIKPFLHKKEDEEG